MERSLKLARVTPPVALLLSGFIGLAHCSSGSSSVTPPHDGGAHASSSSSSGGFAGTSSGGASPGGSSSGASDDDANASDDGSVGDATLADGAMSADAATSDGSPGGGNPGEGGAATSSCQPPQGGSTCDPGVVDCGGTSCTTSSQFCCVAEESDGATGSTCLAYNNTTCPGGALTLGCDETGDCASGVCCEEVIALGVAGPTQCMTSCPSGWFQICKSNTECGGGSSGGGSCIRQTCTQPPTLLSEGSSVIVEACAVPASLTNLNNNGALAGCVPE